MKRFVSLILSVCFLFSINTVSYAANISSRKASNPVIQSMNTLVLKQLGVWFGMPITAAIVVAIIVIGYFLQSVSAEISAYIGCGALMVQVGIIIGILFLLLICYFISTWILFKRSISEN